MVNKQFSIDSKHLVQESLMFYRASGHITHRQDIVLSQAVGNAFAYSPEVSERRVLPKHPAVRHFIQLGNAYTVLVGRHLLGHNVHGYLAQIHVGTYSCRSCNACFRKDMTDHLHRQLMSSHPVCCKIGGRIDEDLVDGIDVDVIRTDIFQVDVVDSCTVFYVVSHVGRSHHIVYGQAFIAVQLLLRVGFSTVTSLPVCHTYFLNHLE